MKEKVLPKEEKEKLRKERQKRRKYRLLILLLLMLGTGTMLATSTYAWFTSNKNVSVETLKVNIQAKNGIQISADGTKWKSIVQKADLVGAHGGNYAAAVNQIPESLEPVSTAAVPDTNGYLPMYYGVVETSDTVANNGEYILTATKTTEKDNSARGEGEDADPAKFIAFDLFFKVNDTTPIYLQAGSGVLSATEQDNGIKNASRIAFVKLGETPDGSELATIQALNAGVASEVTVWEPNYNVHTDAGVANAKDVYGITTAKLDENLVPYSGIKDTILKTDDILLGDATQAKHEDKFTTVTPGKNTIAGFSTNVALFTLNKGITKMRIYMWVEGQDVDCENNASGGEINFDLKISTVAPTVAP